MVFRLQQNIIIILSKFIVSNYLRVKFIPSEDEDSEVPSDLLLLRSTDESRWETEEVINSPPDATNAFSSKNKENNVLNFSVLLIYAFTI